MKQIQFTLATVGLALAMQTTVVKAQSSSAANDKTVIITIQNAIGKYPDSLALHEAYIKESGFTKWGVGEDPKFINQYKTWMQKFPKSAILPYALGHAYADRESPKAKPFLLKAIELNPNLDIAYFDLWIDAERWGEFDKGTAYLKKASEIKPNNPDYAFYYASSFSKKNEQKKYEELSLAVAERFPQHERGAQALYWLAARNTDETAKMKYFELLKNKYPFTKFRWSASGMSSYINLLLAKNPEAALTLARELENTAVEKSDKQNWAKQVTLATQVIEAKSFLAQNKAGEALQVLEQIKVSKYSTISADILLMKSAALHAQSKTNNAYSILLQSYVASPLKNIKKQLLIYGQALNKSEAQIKKEVAYSRDTAARPATDFSLNQYFEKGKASLSNFKGKIVLLTYWFPGCGPCRGEFPHFQNVVNRFDKKDLAYVGINIVPEQNDYVIPFMKSSGYSFIPLEDVEGRNKGNMDNRGAAPVNFLLDQDGKIVFSNFRTDAENEDVLYEMIASTIENKK